VTACCSYEMCVGRPPFFKENANNFYQLGQRLLLGV
jgi:hypothetical protein